MCLRLFLSLILLLSLPAPAAQAAHCGGDAGAIPLQAHSATISTEASGVAAHRHEHGAALTAMAQAATPVADEPLSLCGDCDLGCLAACATVALLRQLPELPAEQPAAVPLPARVSATRLPHRLPLFRPPSPTFR
jgi:hypothetical protein